MSSPAVDPTAAVRRVPAAAATEPTMGTDERSIPARVQPWLAMVGRLLRILLLAFAVLRAAGIV